MKNKFKILDTGNFYFPFIDKGKEFTVEDTIEFTLNKKQVKIIEFCLNKKGMLYFGMLAKPIWDSLKKFNLEEYKNHWFVPVCLYKLGKDYICSVDVLRKARSKKK
ncbi:hypothetical protein FP803_01265 [Candidatus Woesearchaeota archaeon]|nr:hypothetical protein [Candidatus Woesearchaeota archaeon]